MAGYVRELLDNFAEELPLGAATIKEDIDKSGNRFVELIPSNPLSARIRVLDAPGSSYEMVLGRGTVIEIPCGSEVLPRLSPGDDFLRVCRATAKGALVERISLLFGVRFFACG